MEEEDWDEPKPRRSWWQKIIDWRRVSDEDEYGEIKTIVRELIIYLIFLTVLLIAAFGEKGEIRFYYTKAMENLFIYTHAPNGRSYEEMTMISDFWEFAETVLIDGFFWDTWYRSADYKNKHVSDDDNKILYENKLLGLPRIRQVRVRPDSCTIYEDFRRSFDNCYAGYSIDAEDHSSFGPGDSKAWKYSTEEEVGAYPYWGKLAKYSGGGYYQDLPVITKDELANTIKILKDNVWIRRGTRAVFVDFTVYNANVNLFCIIKLVVELPPTGGLIPSWKFNTVKLLRYVTIFDYFVFACEWMVIAFIVYYLVEELTEIIENRLQYLRDGWNIFDLLIIVLSIACIIISIYRTVVVNIKIDRLVDYGDEYPNFESLGYWETQYNNMLAVVVFFVWIKLFKFIRFNKSMNQLSMTLRRCSKDVFGFSVMFFIVFLAYAQLGHLVFGDQLESFNNIVRASFTLLRTILGDFDYDSIAAVDRIIGPIFFLSYIFLVFFILLNMFLAIISDTYSEVKAETENKDIFHMGRFCCRGCRNILVKLKILKPKDDFDDMILTGRKIRNMLLKADFTPEEADRFLETYGVEDEDAIIDRDEAKRLLQDMEGKTNEDIMYEIADAEEEELPPDFYDLRSRVDHIEDILKDFMPKMVQLMRIIEDVYEEEQAEMRAQGRAG